MSVDKRESRVIVTQRQVTQVVSSGTQGPAGGLWTDWDEIPGKPSTYPPSAHNHDTAYDPLGAAANAQAAAIAAAALDVTSKIDALKDGVAADGDTLAKLRGLIQGIQTLLTSDNINLDTLQEVVDFVEAHQMDLEALGVGKVNVSDIINILTDTSSNKPLSAAQGKVLKDALDALTAVVSGKEPTIAAGTTSQYWRGDKSWRDFATDVRAAVLTGLSTATSTVVAAADSVLVAIGKLQAQITGHTGNTSNPHSTTAAQVGADPAGTAASSMSGHVAAADPHTQYALESSLGDAAGKNTGTTAGTVAAGDDARLTNSREWTASTVDQAEAEAGTGTTRRAWTAQRVRQAIAAWWNTITNIDGKNIGATTAGTGRFTTLTTTPASGTVLVGQDASRGTSPSRLQVNDSRIAITSASNGIMGGLRPISSTRNAIAIEADPDNVAASSDVSVFVDNSQVALFNPSGLSVTGNLTTTGNTTLGDSSSDTVTVNGVVGVGGASNADSGVFVRSSALTGSAQYGIYSAITSSTTGSINGFLSEPRTASAAVTTATIRGFFAADAVKGAGSTITSQHGIVVADQTQGVNNYGITSQVSAGTNKRNLNITGTADNYLAGKLGLNTTNIPDSLSINGNITLGFSASPMLRQSTNDGSDDARIQLCGGGAAGAARGAYINIHGNEHATHPGMCDLLAGDTASGGSVRLYTAGNILRLEVTRTGTVRPGADNTQSLGEASYRWSAVHTNDLTATGNTTLGANNANVVSVNGYVAIGGASNQARALNIQNADLVGTTQSGVRSAPQLNSGGTAGCYGFVTSISTQAAAFTTGIVAGFAASNVTKGAGSTITNQHGVLVLDQTQGTNNYGITSEVSAGTNKRNLNITGTADNVLMGPLHVGATSARPVELAGGSTAGAVATVNIERTGGDSDLAGITITRNASGASNYGPNITLARSNASTLGGVTAVVDGSRLGGIAWAGADGTDTRPKAAEIHAVVSGTVASNSVPGDLIFGTTPAGGVSPAERVRITSGGAVLLGSTTALSTSISSSTLFAGLQNHGADAGASSMLQARWSNDVNQSYLQLAKSRGSAVGTHAIVAQNDFVGSLSFAGSDGSRFVEAARISCDVNGVPALGAMPGALRLMTTPAGSDTPLTRVMVTSTGVVDVISGQIKFPATQNASADANTLDDYEEGTFTPTIVGTTTAGTGTYTVQVGRYQKVGDKVSFSLHLAWSAHTGTGFMRIANMPFLSKAESNLFSAVAIRHTGLSLAANSIAQGYVPTSSTQILFTQVTTGGGDAAGIDIDTSATLLVSGHYFV